MSSSALSATASTITVLYQSEVCQYVPLPTGIADAYGALVIKSPAPLVDSKKNPLTPEAKEKIKLVAETALEFGIYANVGFGPYEEVYKQRFSALKENMTKLSSEEITFEIHAVLGSKCQNLDSRQFTRQ